MTFVDIQTRHGMINLDGYSRRKTLKGALKDLAREVAKIDEGEARAITDYIDDTVKMVADGMPNEAGCYYIEAQEVACASRYKFLNGDEDDFSEENVEMEYAEGNWYLYIRFVAPEQETEATENEQEAGEGQEAEQTASALTDDEIKFFNDTVAKIKYSVNVCVPIEYMNHEQLDGKHKEALGICWAQDDGTGKPIPYRITIDEFFIHECFVALEKPYMKIEPETLEQVIAHEIAHLHVWRHGKKHTELTERICRLIEKGEPHGLDNNEAAHFSEAGQVKMAAMQPASTTQQTVGAAQAAEAGENTAWVYDDGGRAAAGFKGTTGDCVCRAISIAAQLPYREVYDLINEFGKRERGSKKRNGKSSARTGVYKDTTRKVMEHLGWKWTPTMQIGQGCTTHLRADELPAGRIVVNLSKHSAAVIDGVLHDTYDSSRGGTRCVYGYFSKA